MTIGERPYMREDLDNYLGIDEGGDDLQAPATARAAFDVDIEYPFEQARPAHAPGRFRMRGRRVVIASLMGVGGRARNNLRP